MIGYHHQQRPLRRVPPPWSRHSGLRRPGRLKWAMPAARPGEDQTFPWGAAWAAGGLRGAGRKPHPQGGEARRRRERGKTGLVWPAQRCAVPVKHLEWQEGEVSAFFFCASSAVIWQYGHQNPRHMTASVISSVAFVYSIVWTTALMYDTPPG